MTHEVLRHTRAFAVALLAGTSVSVLALGAAAEQGTLEIAMQEQIAANEDAAASQAKINDLDDETRKLLAEYRQALAEADSINKYNEQLSVQVKSQVEEVAFVEGQLVDIETTAREVLPLMQKMLATLEQFVSLDVPFQPEERQKRISGLQDMMNRADVSISEKFRRIIEAYQIEMEYGRTLEAYQGKLGEGDDARTVQFLRVGRIALMYQTMDGKETGYWDAEKKTWVIDNDYRQAVRHGFEIALKQGAPNLIEVPVPAPKESKS
jgi:uncharacterized protein (DUF3084 family)